MLENYHILTITHRNLDVEEIGQFILSENDGEGIDAQLHRLKEDFDIDEMMYLSTCNRVSYMFFTEKVIDQSFIAAFFSQINADAYQKMGVNSEHFVSHFAGEEAVNHLFEVAGSVDSLVVGEREIFRQFRLAYDRSLEANLVGDHFRLLEKYTVQTAKEIYAKTKIGEKPLSIVSLAIQKLLNTQRDTNSRILLVGAGETNSLVGKFLKKYHFNQVKIFNRSLDNAKVLADYLDAESFHLSELDSYHEGFDIMIVCTGASEPIVNSKNYQSLLRGEEDKKVLIDLSVPRNIDEAVVSDFNTEYISIDALRGVAESNLQDRKNEINAAKEIIQRKLREFKKIHQHRQIELALQEVPKEIKAIKEKTVQEVYKESIDQLPEESRKLVLEMMDYMEKKCISVPMRLAKNTVK